MVTLLFTFLLTQSPDAGAPPLATSLVRVRCQSECTVKVAGSPGRRVNPLQWEFDEVKPGQTRVEADGFAGLKQTAGFVEVPASSEVEILLTSGKVVLGTVKPRAAAAPAKEAAGGSSTLVVNCAKPCTVFVDGQRRSSEGVKTVRVPEVAPGRHAVQVKSLGASAAAELDVPAASEVFLMPSDATVRVTSTKPLGP